MKSKFSVTHIIEAFCTSHREPDDIPHLEVAEFFCDSIQGEGISMGVPSAFLRLKGCTLNCDYCDTAAVRRQGSAYTFEELFFGMEVAGLPDKLKAGQHLVITGGSPLKQQTNLTLFIEAFVMKYGFLPFIEIENECALMPIPRLEALVTIWNNSPKLKNSGNKISLRYQPDVLKHMSSLSNSYFKFVVSKETDWKEIDDFFIKPGYIDKTQVILMPQGSYRLELERNRELVIKMAVEHGVRYSTREHIILWDKKVGV